MDIKFNSGSKHKCDVKLEGDWLVFTCDKCPEFERRINKVTNEMRSKYNPENPNRHNGNCAPMLISVLN